MSRPGTRQRNLSLNDRRRLTSQILTRDGADCFYCGHVLGHDRSLEHLDCTLALPEFNRLTNLVLAHRGCNQDASDMGMGAKLVLRDIKGFMHRRVVSRELKRHLKLTYPNGSI